MQATQTRPILEITIKVSFRARSLKLVVFDVLKWLAPIAVLAAKYLAHRLGTS